MYSIILYIAVSVVIIWLCHFLYFSLKEIVETPPMVVDTKKENEKRENILSHLKDEEREENELKEYLKKRLI